MRLSPVDSTLSEIARIIENGLFRAVSEGVKTRDLGGNAFTTEFTEAIIERLGTSEFLSRRE
jgi:isocitrate/isopropylmalate dehydrogenase